MTRPTDQSEIDEKITQFENLFRTIRIIIDTEMKIQLKPIHLPRKQKASPILYHSQNYIEKEINNLYKSADLARVKKVDEECFVSPVVITLKKEEIN